jgi:mono/diheme cytochrome c family protein
MPRGPNGTFLAFLRKGTRQMQRKFLGIVLITVAFLARSATAQTALTEAAQIYEGNCAECHGQNLESGGAVPDLRQLGAEDKDRFINIIAEGKGQMPPFAGTLDDEEIEKLWDYIRSKAR